VTLLTSKDERNREYKGYLNEETILCLLDEMSGNMEFILNSNRASNIRERVARIIGYSNDPAAKEILLKALKSEKTGL